MASSAGIVQVFSSYSYGIFMSFVKLLRRSVCAGRLLLYPKFALLSLGLAISLSGGLSARVVLAQSAGHALQTIFSPQRAPGKRTMGLLQRSFLDLVESKRGKLQVALVVDGTESMADDLQGVRQALGNMVVDLQRYRGEQVSFAIVVYRDLGAKSGPVTIPIEQFTGDRDVLFKQFSDIKTESGAPYFYEATDLGVHTALSKLNWDPAETTTRWVMLFGDAPPYDSGFKDTKRNSGARRYYDTDLLLDLARRKKITINSVLCKSRIEDSLVYSKVIDKTRSFMSTLSSETDGLMLDLSYPEIRQTLLDATREPDVEYQRIGTITRADILAIREAAQAEAPQQQTQRRIRMAVLPHLPLDQLVFDADNEAVRVATELRMKLRSAPQTDCRGLVEVQRAIQTLRSSPSDPDKWLQELAVRMRVDYVVWGGYRKRGDVAIVATTVFSKSAGKIVAEANVDSADINATDTVGRLSDKLIASVVAQSTDPVLAMNLSPLKSNKVLNKMLISPVSNSTDDRDDLLTGFELLERSLAFSLRDPQGLKLAEDAAKRLSRFADDNYKDAFAHHLLASCHFNLARLYLLKGNSAAAATSTKRYATELKRAYRYRSSLTQLDLQAEIEADHALLIDKDYKRAIAIYEKLTVARQKGPLHVGLRAHWMLAGIYSGDWNVPEEAIDAPAARRHLVNILAFWESSPEAEFIKQSLRWDDEKGQNNFPFIQRKNNLIVAGL
jgi:tetratricopeptide (TPR) repeat protein